MRKINDQVKDDTQQVVRSSIKSASRTLATQSHYLKYVIDSIYRISGSNSIAKSINNSNFRFNLKNILHDLRKGTFRTGKGHLY